MTAVVTGATAVREVFPLRRQIRISIEEWFFRHRVSLPLVAVLLLVVGLVHGIGMSTFPRWVDDPGTYLSQAWSLRYERALSPYSYFYDHAPGGWMQIAAWAALTGGFDRYDTAIGFGNECMLLAKLASAALLYVLGRRLGFSRPGSSAVVLLFALCPLELVYSRWTFLDNLATPWLLLAFVLAASPRRSIAAATGAAAAFAMAALTKETVLILLPAFAWAMLQNVDRRNRAQVLTVAAFAGTLIMLLYPLYALYKGELLDSPDRNSLLGTARWQLLERQSSGSLVDSASATYATFGQWLDQDPVLLLGGLAALPVGLLVRRLRPYALVVLIGWLVLVRGGYLPFMHVLTMLPWSALLMVGAVEWLAGRRVDGRTGPRPGWWSRRTGRLVTATVATAGALAMATTVVSWEPDLRRMMTVSEEPPLRSATRWVADNVPRDKVIVAHDAIWTDLVHQYGFDPEPIIVYKLDTDPAVQAALTRIDYVVLPDWYFRTPDAASKYPTAAEARKHAVAAARFGTGADAVTVYRVSSRWAPR